MLKRIIRAIKIAVINRDDTMDMIEAVFTKEITK
jgi:hypothetical protein